MPGVHAAIINQGIFGSPLIVFVMRNRSAVTTIDRGDTVIIGRPPNPLGTDVNRMWCLKAKAKMSTKTQYAWSSRTGFFVAGVAQQTISPLTDGAVAWSGLLGAANCVHMLTTPALSMLYLSTVVAGKLSSNAPIYSVDAVAWAFRMTSTYTTATVEVVMKDV